MTLPERQHFYLQDYYIKEVAENCMLHLTVEDAQAWHRHVASVLQDNRFAARGCSRRSCSRTARW